ncbi:hypothetical protein MACH15_23270 [Maricaulis maris]|nr:hypothetical protein MACH15_23270 [Maricaulis maris]
MLGHEGIIRLLVIIHKPDCPGHRLDGRIRARQITLAHGLQMILKGRQRGRRQAYGIGQRIRLTRTG